MGLQRLPLKVAQIGRVAGTDENAEFADRDCRDCEGECLSRSPADIIKTADIAKSVSRFCRDYRYCRPRLCDCTLRLKIWRGCRTRLPGLPPKDAGSGGVAESVGISVRDCRKSWSKLLRLRRILPADIAETAAIDGSAENADISKIVEIDETVAEIAGITNFAGPEREIACWAWKNDEIVGRDCRDWRGWRP